MPESLDSASYAVYDVNRTRLRNNGLAAMPQAGPDGLPQQFVKLHAATEFELVTFFVARDGAPPVVPSPDDLAQDPNYVCMGWQFGAMFQRLNDDGSHRYEQTGQYYYALQYPTGLDNGFPTGIAPYETGDGTSESLPASLFQNGIFGSNGGSTPAQPIGAPSAVPLVNPIASP